LKFLSHNKRVRKFLFCILCLPVLISFFPNPVQGKSNDDADARLAVLVVLDRINIEDLAGDYPNLKSLIDKGVLGLMNIRTAGRYDPASGYLTLGAGTRANVPPGVGQAFGFSEMVEEEKAHLIYENITGKNPAPTNILNLDIAKIITENKKQDHEIIPGLLGQTLKNADVNVVLLGNADTPKEKNRWAALIGMDTSGRVAGGEIGEELLSKDPTSPFLVKTNYPLLLQKFKEYRALNRDSLVIIHLGDTVRADKSRDYVTPERVDFFRSKALKACDDFLGSILQEIDLEKDLVLVVTPFPSLTGYNEKNLLTPFIMAGPDIEPGLAFSATTRREGIIANIDLAPTILNFFKVTVPDLMLGYPITARSSLVDSFSALYEMNRQMMSTYVQRAYLIKPFVGLQIIVSLSFLLLFFLKRRRLNILKPFILASLTVPFILLILSLFSSNSLWSKYFWLLLFMIVLTLFILIIFRNALDAIAFISLITALGILLDLSQKAPLMKVSVLGYDPIGGSRYYGLGNEYMGVLIGSLIIGLMAFLDKYKLRKGWLMVIAGIFLVSFYFILSPEYGSNVGGTISAFGAFMVTFLLLFDVKVGWRHLLFIGLGIFPALFILFFVISPQATPSHISKTVELIQGRGWQSLVLIFGRKLAMNYKLLRYTVWTRALLTSMVVLVALLSKPPYLLKTIFQKYKYLYRGFIGTGIGCLLALVFNDSGIVAAATMMIFIALPVLLLVIAESS